MWAITPLLRYTRPSHDYPYQGEAVVGRNLQEAQLGVSLGTRIVGFLPRASVQAIYVYSFVEKVLDIPLNRSSGFLELGYVVKRRLYVRATGTLQRTHGGLRFGSVTGNPFPLPGELNTRDRFLRRDRVLRSNYWQVGGGLSYSTGPVDLFTSVTKYIAGTDFHNGQAYNVGATWYCQR